MTVTVVVRAENQHGAVLGARVERATVVDGRVQFEARFRMHRLGLIDRITLEWPDGTKATLGTPEYLRREVAPLDVVSVDIDMRVP